MQEERARVRRSFAIAPIVLLLKEAKFFLHPLSLTCLQTPV